MPRVTANAISAETFMFASKEGKLKPGPRVGGNLFPCPLPVSSLALPAGPQASASAALVLR